MINLHAKFEVSMSTQYENVKSNVNCRNLGGVAVRGHPRSSST